ncbi:MAG: metallophosphoesterase [Lentisphaeria bacterium]|nr:metallophosphoesterase [Lentisphaeria bacterium]
MAEVKFLVFADLHHYPGVFYTEARKRLAQIMQRADDEKVDFAVSLGDFNHSVKTFPEIFDDLKNYSTKLYHTLGNHDTDGAALSDALEYYHMPAEYYYFDVNGFRFIVLDTNYYDSSCGQIHFQYRNYFDFPRTRETMPQKQMDFLKDAIATAPGQCILFSHASLERHHEGGGGTANQPQIREIIRQANANGRKVVLSCNGHHHRDNIRILDNVAYFDVNSASFDWLSKPHELYPEELRKQNELIDHQATFQDALSAIVTVNDDGTIKIDGCKSSFLYGVTREMSPNPICDGSGRPCVAEIQSAHFKLL